MAIDARFKLQSMEQGVPSIVISKNGLFLSVNLYKKLDGASYVQIYLSEETKEIAIMRCEADAEAAVELKISGKYARIYNKDFINKIASLCGTTYEKIKKTVTGYYVSDGDYFVFDLKAAKDSKKRSAAGDGEN